MLNFIKSQYRGWKEASEETKNDIKQIILFMVFGFMVLGAIYYESNKEKGIKEEELCTKTEQFIKFKGGIYQILNCKYSKLEKTSNVTK
jgi:hypothetical protein